MISESIDTKKNSGKSGHFETKSQRQAAEHITWKTLRHILKMILKASVGQIFRHCFSKLLKRGKLFFLYLFLSWSTGLEVQKCKTSSSKTLQRIIDYYPNAAMFLASISIFFLIRKCCFSSLNKQHTTNLSSKNISLTPPLPQINGEKWSL